MNRKLEKITKEKYDEFLEIATDWTDLKEGTYIQIDSINSPQGTEYYKSVISVASLVEDTFYHHNHVNDEVLLVNKHEFGVYGMDWFLISGKDYVNNYKK